MFVIVSVIWYLWLASVLLASVVCKAHAEVRRTKTYTGYRLDPTALRKVFYYDMIMVIVEIDKTDALVNCEMVEFENDEVGKVTLKNLTLCISEPKLLTLDEIMNLMGRCDLLDPHRVDPKEAWNAAHGVDCSDEIISTDIQPDTSSSLEILKGTFWCGAGNIASTYFDLGPIFKLDVCCRAHDMCPSKVMPNSTRYNLTNNSTYTISHCLCDKIFRECLDKSTYIIGDAIGYFYFNVLRMKCLAEKDGKIVFELPAPY